MNGEIDDVHGCGGTAALPASVARYLLYAFCIVVPILFWNGLPTAVAIKQYVGQALILLLIIPVLIQVFQKKEASFPPLTVCLSAILYGCYLVASSLFHPHSDGIVLQGTVFSYLLFFEVWCSAQQETVVRKILFCLCVSGGLVSGYFLLQLSGNDIVAWQSPLNGDCSMVWKGSTFSSRNLMVCFLVGVFPFTLYHVQTSRFPFKVIAGVAGLLVLLTLILCHSRVAIVILILFVPVYLYYASVNVRSPKTKSFMRVFCVMAGVGLLAGCAGAFYLLSKMSPEQLDTLSHARLTLWADTLRLIADSPIFGHGTGSFPRIFPAFQSDALGYLFPFDDAVFFSHNEILEILGESGVVGLVLFTSTIVAILIPVFKKGIRKLTTHPLLFFTSVSLAGCFIFSLIGEACHLFICSAFSWIVLALCNSVALTPIKKQYSLPVTSRAVKVVILIACGIGVTFLMVMQVRSFLSDLFLHKAIYAVSQSKATADPAKVVTDIEKSLKCNSGNLYARYQLAYVATLQGQLYRALDLYTGIQNGYSYFENTHYNKGVIYYQQKEFKKAIDTLLVAQQRYPTFNKSLYYLACSYFELEDWKHSSFWCKRYRELDSTNARINMMSDWSEKKMSGL